VTKQIFDLDRHFYTRSGLAFVALCRALEEHTENEELDLRERREPEPPIFYPSNLTWVDANVGGWYGLSVITAEKGTGKTMLALAAAIEAAASGEWQVVHFLAEDDYDGFIERFENYMREHPGAADCYERLHVVTVGKGQTPMTLTHTISEVIDLDLDLPVLVGIDSVNSVVNLSGKNYLQQLAQFGLWAMYARRESRGNCAFLITAESNKRGEAKGENLPYWADVVLKMKKTREKNVVEMVLDKSRRTKGEGKMGKYYRVWHTGEFKHADEVHGPSQPELHVVPTPDPVEEQPVLDEEWGQTEEMPF